MAESKPEDTTKMALQVAQLVADRCALEVRAVEKSLSERSDMHHREAMAKIEKVEQTQVQMQIGQARIETRLDEGERRFENIEARVAKVEELEPRVVGLEQREQAREGNDSVSPKKKIILVTAGATGIGAAGWAIIDGLIKVFGGGK